MKIKNVALRFYTVAWKSNYCQKVVVAFMIGIFSQVSADYPLSHVCAYSNESVVKFRDKTLKHSSLHSLAHPGVSLDWPIDLCEFWISSLYGMRNKKMHNGVDMAALTGTLVKSSGDGIVISAAAEVPGYGTMIEIEHKGGRIKTRYAHLDKMLVFAGQKVKKGQNIGKVGSTGNVRGSDPSHLHFEIFHDGVRLDPLKYLYSAEIQYKNLKNKR